MLDTLKLDVAVGLLTRESKHRLVTEESIRWVTADPLLVQLRIAIGHSSAPVTFKASAGSPIPLAVGAYDLLTRIAESTTEHWWQLHTLHHGQGRTSLVGQLRAWAMVARLDPETLREAEGIICGWVEEIQGMFEPTRRWEIKGTCPACKVSKVVIRDDPDEGTVRAPALAVIYDRTGQLAGAECAACGNHWPDPMVLARAVEAQ